MSGSAALVLLVLFALTPGPARSQPAASGDAVVCRIGVNIEDLYDFDLTRETFGAVLWLWSLCPSADPAPLETIVFRTALPGLQLGEIHGTPIDGGGLYQYRRVQRHLPPRLGHEPLPVRPAAARDPLRRERSQRCDRGLRAGSRFLVPLSGGALAAWRVADF